MLLQLFLGLTFINLQYNQNIRGLHKTIHVTVRSTSYQVKSKLQMLWRKLYP